MGFILNMIYPPRCPVCDGILYEKDRIGRPAVCRKCVPLLKRISYPSCMKCGKQLEDEKQELCHDCAGRAHDYVRGVAAFSYTDAMKNSMYAFKYNNRREYADFYADSICDFYGNTIRGWKADVIMPVPLHKSRLRTRGYNQAALLGRCLARKLDIPYDEKTLFRTRKTTPLKELSDKERVTGLKSAFQVSGNSVEYKKIILADDIYTTGATIDECARTLLSAGASEIYFAVVCIGRGF